MSKSVDTTRLRGVSGSAAASTTTRAKLALCAVSLHAPRATTTATSAAARIHRL
jgi:hypothetical protein